MLAELNSEPKVLLQNDESWNACIRKRNLFISTNVAYNDFVSQQLYYKNTSWSRNLYKLFKTNSDMFRAGRAG
jgi:hypothetical protein